MCNSVKDTPLHQILGCTFIVIPSSHAFLCEAGDILQRVDMHSVLLQTPVASAYHLRNCRHHVKCTARILAARQVTICCLCRPLLCRHQANRQKACPTPHVHQCCFHAFIARRMWLSHAIACIEFAHSAPGYASVNNVCSTSHVDSANLSHAKVPDLHICILAPLDAEVDLRQHISNALLI